MSRLKIITEMVDKLSDGLGLRIDPKIKKAVVAFNYAGFHTSQSCEGHLDEWGTPYPWVEIDNIFSILNMKELLDEFYFNREKSVHYLRIVNDDISYRVQSDDIMPSAELVPLYIRDSDRLLATQKEMDAFSYFLIIKKTHII